MAAVSDWGVAVLTRPGETACGDRHVVQAFDGGVLVAVIDALGHGEDAARVAEVAAQILIQYAGETPASLIARCHARLRSTRGATISIACFDWHRRVMTWVGVGNVAGALISTVPGRASQIRSLLVRSGVVGDHLVEPRASVLEIDADSVLVMASDGVRRDFTEMLPCAMAPQKLAQQALVRYATQDDDATVLVFRCGGNC